MHLGGHHNKTAQIMSCQVTSYRKVQENDSLIVLAHVALFYVANPTHLAEPTQILKTIIKKRKKKKG